ncbi:MAG: hypothetical protein IPN76_14115 [Saprospiraceae bacterium]|nr:hypothetical protein [Saprospiraceae bacterium]
MITKQQFRTFLIMLVASALILGTAGYYVFLSGSEISENLELVIFMVMGVSFACLLVSLVYVSFPVQKKLSKAVVKKTKAKASPDTTTQTKTKVQMTETALA